MLRAWLVVTGLAYHDRRKPIPGSKFWEGHSPKVSLMILKAEGLANRNGHKPSQAWLITTGASPSQALSPTKVTVQK